MGGRLVRHLGPERCLVDGFDRPRLFGGVAELVASLDGLPYLDLGLLEETLGIMGSRTLNGAVGWYLERHADDLFVPEATLARLHAGRPASPHYLERRTGGSELVPRWNVLVPRSLLRQERDDG